MKKNIILLFIFIFTISLSLISPAARAQEAERGEGTEKIEYVLFHLETCPHCRDEIRFLEKKILPRYGEYIDLKMYEVREEGNADIFRQYGVYYNVEVGSVPLAIISGEIVSGFGTDKTTGAQILSIIETKLTEKGVDITALASAPTARPISPAFIYGGLILAAAGIWYFFKRKNRQKRAN